MRNLQTRSQPRGELLIAYLAAAAVGTHLLESALPGLGPWFKPGLANTFTLVAFFHLGWKAATGVTLIRVLVGSMTLGTFLSPTFFLSLSGAIGAVLSLGVVAGLGIGHACGHGWHDESRGQAPLRQDDRRRLGPVGVSLLASLAHMICQVLAAWLLIIGHSGIFLALPWFLLGSWLTGIVNGLLAFLILERLAQSSLLGENG
ncbi:MAG: Gx transporter family protein [Magnetococcales bacterium]|nr:Gx transporter family protein [Magnetococcales bacterium]